MERKVEWLVEYIKFSKDSLTKVKEMIKNKLLCTGNITYFNNKAITISEYIEKLENEIKEGEEILKEYVKLLQEDKPIQGDLIYYILIMDLKPSQAVKKVAYRYNKTERTIWKNYYKKVNNFILKYIEKYSKNNDKL